MDQGNGSWLPGSIRTHGRFKLRTLKEAVGTAVCFSSDPPGCFGAGAEQGELWFCPTSVRRTRVKDANAGHKTAGCTSLTHHLLAV